MSVVGVITEYNPFHLGHRYHLEKAKKLTGSDCAIVIMSGNYVQRGEPSFVDKYTKTKIALNNGADMVFELPFCFSCSSAEYFATAAITLLDRTGIIDYICFGTECSDLKALQSIAEILISEPPEYKALLKLGLKKGASYPAAREEAIKSYISKKNTKEIPSEKPSPDIHAILSMPNNILAIEYLKALKKLNSNIKPIIIQRTMAGYQQNDAENCCYCAAAIRSLDDDNAVNSNDITLKSALCTVDSQYMDSFHISYPVTVSDFDLMLGKALYEHCSNNTLKKIFGINDSLGDKIKNNIYSYISYMDFTAKMASKNLNRTAVSRALLHALLNIYKEDIDLYMSRKICSFIRVLGVSPAASHLFNKIKKCSNLRIIGQLSETAKLSGLSDTDRSLLEKWIYSDHIYRMAAMNKYKNPLPTEYNVPLIKN